MGRPRRLYLLKHYLIGLGLFFFGSAAMAQDPRLAEFDFATVNQQRNQQEKSYLEFLRTSSMHCGIYHLAAGSKDPQSPHDEDELYYVQSGIAKFHADGQDTEVKPGSILFVKAHEKHYFHSIEEDLTLLVVFSTAKSSED